SIVHGVPAGENALRGDALVYEVAFHVLTVGHDGVSVPVEVASQWKEEPVRPGLQPHPDAGPQDKGTSFDARDCIGKRQRKASVNALDVDVVVVAYEFIGQRRHDARL